MFFGQKLGEFKPAVPVASAMAREGCRAACGRIAGRSQRTQGGARGTSGNPPEDWSQNLLAGNREKGDKQERQIKVDKIKEIK